MLEAEAKHLRLRSRSRAGPWGRGQGRGRGQLYEAEAETEAKDYNKYVKVLESKQRIMFYNKLYSHYCHSVHQVAQSQTKSQFRIVTQKLD